MMMGKLGFLAGLGIGYVLGTRSGNERYQQIKAKARGVWLDPRVQKSTDQAQEVVMEKADQAAHVVRDMAADVGSAVSSKVSETIGRSDSFPEPTAVPFPYDPRNENLP